MNAAPLALVVAVAENGVIGARGGLPWRIKADLRRFRAVTMGKPIVMGRKTFDSIGRVLDGRDNIIVTRQTNFAPADALVAGSIEAAFDLAQQRARACGASEICVIGGAALFQAALPAADRLHVTHVAGAPEGDVFFPQIPAADWREIAREKLPFSEGDTAEASYAVYERRR